MGARRFQLILAAINRSQREHCQGQFRSRERDRAVSSLSEECVAMGDGVRFVLSAGLPIPVNIEACILRPLFRLFGSHSSFSCAHDSC